MPCSSSLMVMSGPPQSQHKTPEDTQCTGNRFLTDRVAWDWGRLQICTKRRRSGADEQQHTLHVVQQFVYARDAAKQWASLIGLLALPVQKEGVLKLRTVHGSIKVGQLHLHETPITVWGEKIQWSLSSVSTAHPGRSLPSPSCPCISAAASAVFGNFRTWAAARRANRRQPSADGRPMAEARLPVAKADRECRGVRACVRALAVTGMTWHDR